MIPIPWGCTFWDEPPVKRDARLEPVDGDDVDALVNWQLSDDRKAVWPHDAGAPE